MSAVRDTGFTFTAQPVCQIESLFTDETFVSPVRTEVAPADRLATRVTSKVVRVVKSVVALHGRQTRSVDTLPVYQVVVVVADSAVSSIWTAQLTIGDVLAVPADITKSILSCKETKLAPVTPFAVFAAVIAPTIAGGTLETSVVVGVESGCAIVAFAAVAKTARSIAR